jgi:hypothetical protein
MVANSDSEQSEESATENRPPGRNGDEPSCGARVKG